MDLINYAKQLTDAFETGDDDLIRKYLSPDFRFDSPQLQRPAVADEWLGISRLWRVAFPDLRYNFKISVIDEKEQVIMFTTKITGTHNGFLDLGNVVPEGMVVRPTGKRFSLPEENGFVYLRGGKVDRIRVESNENTGILGILKQLGIEIPISLQQQMGSTD